MTAAEIRALHEIAALADRIAQDARSVARRRDLACDIRRLALARPGLLAAHRDVLWSFIPDVLPPDPGFLREKNGFVWEKIQPEEP